MTPSGDTRWFDSHCHLHLCEEELAIDALLEDAAAAGVAGMVAVGIDLDSSRRVVELAAHVGVWAAVGVHPNSSAGFDGSAADTLVELSRSSGVVAVGETGLDFYRDTSPVEDQVGAFRAHIGLAKERDLALVIHTRDSVASALDLLEESGAPRRLVFHCWTGGRDELHRALRLGAFVSFAGNVSFGNAAGLREAAAEVPCDRLLVETDAPFLAPVPHRGRPNRPSLVPLVGRAVAAARAAEVTEVAARTARNAWSLFALDR